MIKAIAIDLDDTLIDTSGLLVPAAAQRACQTMIDSGLNCTLQECVSLRAQFAANLSHRELFKKIAEVKKSTNPQEIGDLGAKAFYGHTQIPNPLPLMPGAENALQTLMQKSLQLFLVTSGDTQTQAKKIECAQIQKYFKKIFIVDKFRNQNKSQAFQEILQETKIQPQELLSVGNRLQEEIRLAKMLSALTCHFAYGEHLGEKKELPQDNPDFTITHWKEFISTCLI